MSHNVHDFLGSNDFVMFNAYHTPLNAFLGNDLATRMRSMLAYWMPRPQGAYQTRIASLSVMTVIPPWRRKYFTFLM
jgi:hypothetical protein